MASTASKVEVDLAPDSAHDAADPDETPLFFTAEEGRREFEAAVQHWMGISGEEFIQRWEAGEYWGVADEEGHRHIGDLIMMIPLARIDR